MGKLYNTSSFKNFGFQVTKFMIQSRSKTFHIPSSPPWHMTPSVPTYFNFSIPGLDFNNTFRWMDLIWSPTLSALMKTPRFRCDAVKVNVINVSRSFQENTLAWYQSIILTLTLENLANDHLPSEPWQSLIFRDIYGSDCTSFEVEMSHRITHWCIWIFQFWKKAQNNT